MRINLHNCKIFSGSTSTALTTAVTKNLHTTPGQIEIGSFSDGETRIEINEVVRGHSIYFIQSTCPPVNDNLIELFIAADAFKRSSAEKLVAVIPYFGYARQDRRPGFTRTAITSSMIASFIKKIGITHIVTIDLHSDQQQGFFKIPVIKISAAPIIVADIWAKTEHPENIVIVSPDAGGVVRARGVAKLLGNADLAIVDKRRERANVSTVMNVIGDVKGKKCIIIDDLIDTAGTLCNSAAALMDMGAISVSAYATHPVFSGPAYENIENSVLKEVVVTDTIPLPSDIPSRIRSLTVAELLSETIFRMESNSSVSEIYMGH